MTRRIFHGVYEGDEDGWKELHEYFQKLAREDDVRETEVVITDRKPTKRKEGIGG